MTTGVCNCRPPSAAEANQAIRRFVAGRAAWSAADLLELDRLRRVWVDASRRQLDTAA